MNLIDRLPVGAQVDLDRNAAGSVESGPEFCRQSGRFLHVGEFIEIIRDLIFTHQSLLLKRNRELSRRRNGRRSEGWAAETERSQEAEGEEWILERLWPEKDKEEVSENGGKNDEKKWEEDRDRNGSQ
jgi:hypothetical protein